MELYCYIGAEINGLVVEGETVKWAGYIETEKLKLYWELKVITSHMVDVQTGEYIHW